MMKSLPCKTLEFSDIVSEIGKNIDNAIDF
jgi:hypothetical protein